MASGARAEKVVHQDYIARIRYSNALPPPPHPPKLLEIPGTGLAGGQYTSAGYASRLARDQPLNIEADAELGMSIDLVGIPGVFDGDERAISVREGPQTIHPADRALLRPLASLGKASATSGAVSFLRRTEYTASQNTHNFSAATPKDLAKPRNDAKRRNQSVNKEDPINIMRNIVKGFDIAYPQDAYKGEDSTTNLRGATVTEAETNAWNHPKHPTNPDLKLLDSYPVLPDLDAIPPAGFYMVMKFISNPVATTGSYDQRLDTAIIKPVIDEQAEARFENKLREWEESKSTKPAPIREYDYDCYIPDDQEVVNNLKRKLDVNDPAKNDDTLYPEEAMESGPGFRYKRLRTYETYNQHGDLHNLYNDSVAMSLYDPELGGKARERLAKGAYFYPLVQRTALRPQRPIGSRQYETKDLVDELHVTISDPSEDILAGQEEKIALLDPTVRQAEPET